MRGMLVGIALASAACAGGEAPAGATGQPAPISVGAAPSFGDAVADPRRPEADLARDADRHPAEVMAFAGVEPGWRIADIGPGRGYYTRLFAVAVGDAGRVFAIDRPNPPLQQRPILAVAPEYPNVTVIQEGYQGWTTDEPLDAIFISQIYHDFHLPILNIDVPRLNREMFAALKPGGVLIIIDHAAVDGSDVSVTGTLHRIDQGQVVRELEAAGFVLEAESQVLRNPADDRTVRVFEGEIRGRTDQFVLRFRKPAN
jgi:predicted methyltransferase